MKQRSLTVAVCELESNRGANECGPPCSGLSLQLLHKRAAQKSRRNELQRLGARGSVEKLQHFSFCVCRM